MKDAISSVDFSDNKYHVKQRPVRNAYEVYNSEDQLILQTKQKLLKMKEEFPFKDSDGNEVFTVKADQIMDIVGDYLITDSNTDRTIAVLKKEFSFLIHKWKITDNEDTVLASIESRGKFFGVLRALSDIFKLLPHKYTINDPDGNQIGQITERLTLLRDKYEVEIDENAENREALIAATVTIDALEGN